MKLAFIFLLFSGLGLARDDHSSLWTGVRKQKSLGACHAFATTALVEALYSEVNGTNIDLSEADVFARSYFGRDRQSSHQGFRWIVEGSIGLGLPYLDENQGGYVDDDFELIKNSGIQTEDESPYEGLLGLLDSIKDSVKDYRKELHRTSFQRDHRIKSEELAQEYQDQIQSFYAASPSALSISQLLSEYKVHRIDLPGNTEDKIQVLKSYVSCRPVAISIQSSALKSTSSGMHAVVLRGFSEDRFLIRNSWAGKGESSGKTTKLAPFIERAFVIMEKDRLFPKRDCQ